MVGQGLHYGYTKTIQKLSNFVRAHRPINAIRYAKNQYELRRFT